MVSFFAGTAAVDIDKQTPPAFMVRVEALLQIVRFDFDIKFIFICLRLWSCVLFCSPSATTTTICLVGLHGRSVCCGRKKNRKKEMINCSLISWLFA